MVNGRSFTDCVPDARSVPLKWIRGLKHQKRKRINKRTWKADLFHYTVHTIYLAAHNLFEPSMGRSSSYMKPFQMFLSTTTTESFHFYSFLRNKLVALTSLLLIITVVNAQQADLTFARTLWTSQNLNQYGFLVEDDQGLYHDGPLQQVYVQVTNTVVTFIDIQFVDGETPTANMPNINGIFDIIQDAIDTNKAVTVSYDSALGYPTSISIDSFVIEILEFNNIDLLKTEFNQAFQLWKDVSMNVQSYTYQYRRSCFRCPSKTVKVLVGINGNVISVDGTSIENYVEVEPFVTRTPYTIDELFIDIEQLITFDDGFFENAWTLRVKYNDQYGYPEELFLDYDLYTFDEELDVLLSDVFLSVRPTCGDSICQDGENCENCPEDCRKRIYGNPDKYFCCYGGPAAVTPTFNAAGTYSAIAKSCEFFKCQRFGLQCDTSESLNIEPECQVDNDCPNINNDGSNICIKNLCVDGVCEQTIITPSTAICGDGICQASENCENCQQDCRRRTHGVANKRYCCYGGSSVPTFVDFPTYNSIAISCGDQRCTQNQRTCDTTDAAIAVAINPSNYCGPEECTVDDDCFDPNICTADICRGGVCINRSITLSVRRCGDDVCQDGENCENCPQDCRRRRFGNPNRHFCCYGGPASATPSFTDSTWGSIAIHCGDHPKCLRKSKGCDMNIAPTIPDSCAA